MGITLNPLGIALRTTTSKWRAIANQRRRVRFDRKTIFRRTPADDIDSLRIEACVSEDRSFRLTVGRRHVMCVVPQ